MNKLLVIGLGLAVWLQATTPVALVNPGFENQLESWQSSNGMSTVTEDSAHTGKYGLRVLDKSTEDGSGLYSTAFTVKTGTAYKLTFWARKREAFSQGTNVYVRFFNDKGRQFTPNDIPETYVSTARTMRWKQHAVSFIVPKDAVVAKIWIHSVKGAISDDALDDFELFELTETEAREIKTDMTLKVFTPPSKERIAEIAAMLPDNVQGLGYPAADRGRWDHIANQNGRELSIQEAEAFINTPPPELKDEEYLLFLNTGDRSTYQRPYFIRRNRLVALAVAEALENKGRFLPALERDIKAMLVDKSWTLPAHDAALNNFKQIRFSVDLFASERAADLATIDWWFQDKLKPEVREGIRREIYRRIIDPYLHSIRTGDLSNGHWWIYADNNWNAVCSCNMVNAVLAIVPEKLVRAEVIAATEISDDRFLAGFTPDGYCNEGVGYWNYGFGHYLVMGEHILQVTNGKLSIFNKPEIEAIAAFAKNIQIENGIAPAFADCSVGAQPGQDILTLIQRHWPQALNCQAKVQSTIRTGFPFMPLLAFADETSYQKVLPEEAAYPLRSAFPDSGIYVCRNNINGKIFGAVIKGGHNAEHHNHNDIGSMMISWNSKRLVIDPGAETYTRQTGGNTRYTFNLLNSFGHPVPVVAGQLQVPGQDAQGVFTKCDFTDEKDTLVLDLKAAYDVMELEELTRTFCFDRGKRQLTVTDHVRFSTPQDFSTALVSGYSVKDMGKGRQLIFSGEECLDVAISATGADWAVKTEKIICQFNKIGPNRIGIAMSEPVTVADITMVIRPCETPMELVSAYRAPKLDAFKLDMEHAITVQAEDFDEQQSVNGEKVVIEEKVGAEGKAFKRWDRIGHKLGWNVIVPQDGSYLLQFKACTINYDGATREVLVDGRKIGSVMFPTTGGWSTGRDDWKVQYPTVGNQPLLLKLSGGKHKIEFLNDCDRGLNLDWFKLIPCSR